MIPKIFFKHHKYPTSLYKTIHSKVSSFRAPKWLQPSNVFLSFSSFVSPPSSPLSPQLNCALSMRCAVSTTHGSKNTAALTKMLKKENWDSVCSEITSNSLTNTTLRLMPGSTRSGSGSTGSLIWQMRNTGRHSSVRGRRRRGDSRTREGRAGGTVCWKMTAFLIPLTGEKKVLLILSRTKGVVVWFEIYLFFYHFFLLKFLLVYIPEVDPLSWKRMRLMLLFVNCINISIFHSN